MYTVLYVDDEPGLLDLGKTFLETMGGFRVDIMTSASEALPLLHTRHFDTIVSDYQMPIMDGIDFLRAVRSGGNDIPFILFTGRGREEIVIKALNEGADFYLQKGGDPAAQFAELAHKIRIAIQRRRAARDLEESERRYREVVETQTEFISRFLPDGTHLFVNEAYCRYFGKRREDIIGHRFIPDIHAEDQERVHQHIRDLTPEHPSADIEHRVIMPDGTIRWQWWSDHAIFDPDGRIIEYQSVGKDITDRKSAEEALAESNARLRDLGDNLPGIIYQFEITADGKFRFPYISGRWSEIFDITAEEAMKNPDPVFAKIVPEDLADLNQAITRSARTQEPWQMEFRATVRDKIMWLFGRSIPMTPRPDGSILWNGVLIDITEKKETEAALGESEKKFRAILNQSYEFIGLMNVDGMLVEANQSALAFAGIAAGEVIDKPFWDTPWWTHSPEMQKRLKDAIRRAAGGETIRFEATHPAADGTLAYVDFSLKPVVDEHGIIKYLIPEGRDITERKQAEERLKQSENLYRTIFDFTGAATIIIAPDTTILLANAGWEKLSGMPREEQENKLSWTIFFTKDDLERMKAYHYERRMDPKNVPNVYESRMIDAKGGIHNVIVNVGMIPGTKNSVASLVDITGRRAAEDKLRESEEQYRTIFNTTGAGSTIVDEDTMFVVVNPEFARLIGYPAEELEGKRSWTEFVDPEDLERIRKYHTDRRIDPGSAPGEYELRLRTRDGKIRHCINYVSLIPGTTRSIVSCVDITERRQAEDELRGAYEQLTAAQEQLRTQFDELKHNQRVIEESEEKYRMLAENAPIAIAFLQDNHVVYVNEYAATMAGYSREELCAMNFWDLIHPDCRSQVRARGLARQRGEKVPNRYEVKYVTRSGEIRWAGLSAEQTSYQGRPAGIALFNDITDRKRAEEALRASEEKYRNILETIQECYYRTDAKGTIILVSPSGASLLGYDSPEDLYGRDLATTIYANPQDRKKFLAEIEKTGAVRNYEVLLRKKDATPLTVLTSSHKYYDQDGKFLGIEGIFRDITERKRAEEALIASEEKFAKTFQAIPDFIILTSIPDTRIMDVNDMALQVSGYRPDEMIGRTIIELNLWVDDRAREKYKDLIRNNGRTLNFEAEFRKKSGEIISCLISGTIIMLESGPCFISAVRDITEHKQVEKKRRRNTGRQQQAVVV